MSNTRQSPRSIADKSQGMGMRTLENCMSVTVVNLIVYYNLPMFLRMNVIHAVLTGCQS